MEKSGDRDFHDLPSDSGMLSLLAVCPPAAGLPGKAWRRRGPAPGAASEEKPVRVAHKVINTQRAAFTP